MGLIGGGGVGVEGTSSGSLGGGDGSSLTASHRQRGVAKEADESNGGNGSQGSKERTTAVDGGGEEMKGHGWVSTTGHRWRSAIAFFISVCRARLRFELCAGVTGPLPVDGSV